MTVLLPVRFVGPFLKVGCGQRDVGFDCSGTKSLATPQFRFFSQTLMLSGNKYDLTALIDPGLTGGVAGLTGAAGNESFWQRNIAGRKLSRPGLHY